MGHDVYLLLCMWLLVLLAVQATDDELTYHALGTLHGMNNNVSQQNVTEPSVVTFGDSLTKYGYDDDGWVTLLKEGYSNLRFWVSV